MSRRPGLDRSRVIAAAAASADEFGLESVTLTKLAGRLNVRPPSLYNHVSSVDELRDELAVFAMRALQAELTRAAVGRSGADGVRAIAGAFREFAHRRPGLYAATLRAPRPDDAELQRVAAEFFEVVRAVLAPFALDDEALVHAVRALRSMVHGFVSLEAAGAFALPQSIDESFRLMVDGFIARL